MVGAGMTELIVEKIGALARLRLNRPEAINALTLGMVRGLDQALDQLETDPDVAVILLSGEGARGLCAGGDIRSLYEAPRVTDGASMQFWREEYRLNARIARCPKPFVAYMDGLVMGGGIGVSAHAAFRIVTERSKIGLPECGIGFVPDVGATWLLPRAPGELGLWMGLTGRSLAAADAILLGFGDHYLPSDKFAALIAALAALRPEAGNDGVGRCLAALCEPAAEPPLAEQRAMIDRVFGYDDVSDILAALRVESGEFAARTLADIEAKSPSSLKLALRLARLGREATSLEAAMEFEFAAARALVVSSDFYEGIRAAIIDKDRNPKWQPAALAAVGDAWVEQALQVTADRVFPHLAA
jgi:enoyl-CoA hydratase